MWTDEILVSVTSVLRFVTVGKQLKNEKTSSHAQPLLHFRSFVHFSTYHRYKMSRFLSKADKHSEDFLRNHKEMSALCTELQQRLHQDALFQGRPKDMERHQKRGQLLARDRIELVLDEDSPFLELMPLAGYGQDGSTTGGSIVAGVGLVRYFVGPGG